MTDEHVSLQSAILPRMPRTERLDEMTVERMGFEHVVEWRHVTCHGCGGTLSTGSGWTRLLNASDHGNNAWGSCCATDFPLANGYIDYWTPPTEVEIPESETDVPIGRPLPAAGAIVQLVPRTREFTAPAGTLATVRSASGNAGSIYRDNQAVRVEWHGDVEQHDGVYSWADFDLVESDELQVEQTEFDAVFDALLNA